MDKLNDTTALTPIPNFAPQRRAPKALEELTESDKQHLAKAQEKRERKLKKSQQTK
jgi:hypothetical protein